jgi:molybdopterin molybdotransferase
MHGCMPSVWGKMRSMANLISIEEARRLVLAAVSPLPAEPVPLDAALGRVLAEELVSGLDVPPFRNSAMDGFAVVAGEGGELPLVGESRAGRPFEGTLEAGSAVRISTGAAVPDGADSVVPVELAEASNGSVLLPASEPGANVRMAGEDVREGQAVLAPGTALGPAEVAVAASLGRAELSCARRPRVALIVTGDELAEPGAALAPGQIYSSNGWALAGLVARAGAELVLRETVGDSAEQTRDALGRALDAADLVCVSGGVSVGEHDHVRGALAELGAEQRFWGVALKPGKPTWFGARKGVLAFGLPGNPVSAMVTFQLFARPALLALQGAPPTAPRAEATLAAPVAAIAAREQAVRVRLEPGPEGWLATPTGEQGSHQLTSMLGAGALALIPRGEGELAVGERVTVELL